MRHHCGGQSKSADLLARGGEREPWFWSSACAPAPHCGAWGQPRVRLQDAAKTPPPPLPQQQQPEAGLIAGTLTKAQNACLHDGGHVKAVGGGGEAAPPPPPPREHLRLVRPPAAAPRPPCERRGAEGDASSERCAATLEAGGGGSGAGGDPGTGDGPSARPYSGPSLCCSPPRRIASDCRPNGPDRTCGTRKIWRCRRSRPSGPHRHFSPASRITLQLLRKLAHMVALAVSTPRRLNAVFMMHSD